VKAYKIAETDIDNLLSILLTPPVVCIDLIHYVILLPDNTLEHMDPKDRSKFVEVPPPSNKKIKQCNPNAAKYIEAVRTTFRGREVSPKRLRGIPQSIYCIYNHKLAVKSICKPKIPSTFGAKKTSSDTITDFLRLIFETRLHRFWPPFFSQRLDYEFLGNMLVVGGSRSGKTYFLGRRLLPKLKNPIVVIDPTGEYAKYASYFNAEVLELTVTLGELPLEVFLYAFDIASRITSGVGANWTVVQQGKLTEIVSAEYYRTEGGPDLQLIMDALIEEEQKNPRSDTPKILRAKLSNLCVFDELKRCQPHPAVSTPLAGVGLTYLKEMLKRKNVVFEFPLHEESAERQSFISAFLVHALVAWAMRTGIFAEAAKARGEEHAYLVLDEAHRFLAKDTEDEIQKTFRQGRHAGIVPVLATQSPDDIDPKLRQVLKTVIIFSLTTDKPIYGISPEVIRNFAVGEGVAIVRHVGAFYIPPEEGENAYHRRR